MNSTKDKQAKLRSVEKRWQQRFSVAKLGKEAYSQGDYTTTIKRYNEYLKILADLNDCDIMNIHPTMFKEQTAVSELLLISQIYWELARIYDLSQKMSEHLDKCLEQFVVFTVNQKYQVVNAEMLRKLLKSKKFKNKNKFEAAYKRILVESKRCFIATFVYHENHNVTTRLRYFKNHTLANKPWGLSFIALYYKISPLLVRMIEKNLIIKKITRPFFQFLLYLISIIVKKLS